MKYVALLRGINVGGKNKIAMEDLRVCFEKIGFTDVSTYINSGNVFFSSDEKDEAVLVEKCEGAIRKRFGFEVVVAVISGEDLKLAVDHAPSWWASEDAKIVRSEVLFVISPTTPLEVLAEIHKSETSVDKFASYGQLIFWTLPRANYNKSVLPKIIGTPVYRRITMRGATTTKKLYDLLD